VLVHSSICQPDRISAFVKTFRFDAADDEPVPQIVEQPMASIRGTDVAYAPATVGRRAYDKSLFFSAVLDRRFHREPGRR
jgi:hypothetical protein